MSHELGIHQGKPIMGAVVKISKAGDGLSKPLSAEPRGFDAGEKFPVMLLIEVGPDTNRPVKLDDGEIIGFIREFNFIAEEAIVLDQIPSSQIDAMFEEQRAKVRAWDVEQARLKAEAKGIHELPLGADGNGEEPDEDADWESEARAQAPASLGSKRAAKAAKEAAG